MIKDRRIGRFIISRHMLETGLEKVAEFTASMVVLRAEYLIDMDGIQYTAWSPSFDPVPNYCMAPNYDVVFNNDTGKLGLWVSFGKVQLGQLDTDKIDYMAAVRDSAKAQ